MNELKKEEKCILCKSTADVIYLPMKEWNIDGTLCGKCYSKKISEFYPGEHVRVNLTDD